MLIRIGASCSGTVMQDKRSECVRIEVIEVRHRSKSRSLSRYQVRLQVRPRLDSTKTIIVTAFAFGGCRGW